MNYYEIKHLVPAGLKKKSIRRILTPKSVLLFFLAQMILFVSVGGWIQYRLGMGGVVITELMMLALSVGFVALIHADWREVFPLKKPKLSAVAGSTLLWGAAILSSFIANYLLIAFFPETYQSFSEESSALYGQLPLLLQILIIAVLPAICEEALHRGVIQCGMRYKVRQIPLLCVIMGAVFAVFHIYPIKYAPMFILGGMMSYLLAMTGNMFYSSYMHFLNNLFAVLTEHAAAGLLSGSMLLPGILPVHTQIAETVPELPMVPLSMAGSAIILFGLPVPFLLHAGRYLLALSTAPVRPDFFPAGEKKPVFRRIILPMFWIVLLGLLVMTI